MTYFQNIQLSPKDIETFQNLLKQEYNIHLSNEEAEKEALRFLQFMSFMVE